MADRGSADLRRARADGSTTRLDHPAGRAGARAVALPNEPWDSGPRPAQCTAHCAARPTAALDPTRARAAGPIALLDQPAAALPFRHQHAGASHLGDSGARGPCGAPRARAPGRSPAAAL